MYFANELSYKLPPNYELFHRRFNMKVPLCKLEVIPEERTKTIDFFGREVLVLKAEGKPKAILNVCMHLGGPMKRGE